MDSNNAYIYTGGSSATPSEQVNLSTGVTSYTIADALRSVRGIADSSGNLVATTAYDAWGNPETAGGLSSFTPFGFVGGYTDPTGLVYLLHRYYDPGTGQFISVDPLITTTKAPYIYAADDPVNNIDPNGSLHFRLRCCIHLNLFYSSAFTANLAESGVKVWASDLTAIAVILNALPIAGEVADLILAALTDLAVAAVDEAIHIVGGTSESVVKRYRGAANKQCLWSSSSPSLFFGVNTIFASYKFSEGLVSLVAEPEPDSGDMMTEC
jgi:RHS repeat-associated protein